MEKSSFFMKNANDTKSKKTTLIVEDDKFLIKAYQIKFNSAGFNIIVAVDGVAGLELARKELPSLILLDLMLPKMNGFEFLKALKADEKTKDIPVIILSNLGQQGDREKALSLGAVDYLVKTDYKLEEIVKKVKELV